MVRDTLDNVRRFVARNLAGGVDHMFVVLDTPDAGVEAFLAEHPHVTGVVADDEWWQGERPYRLNLRQTASANKVRTVLSGLRWAEWLVHIDADEVVQVDRAVLAGVPPAVGAVRLEPREVVGTWAGGSRLFKRLLTPDELDRLVRLGVIRRPHNDAYFRGHPVGKSGVRPARDDLWLSVHFVVGPDGETVPAFTHPALEVLHYESASYEEFARKWTALLDAENPPAFRPDRQGTADAVRPLLGRPGSMDALRLVFEKTVLDEVDLLAGQGMLLERDPDQGRHAPEPLPPGERERLDRGIADVRALWVPRPRRDTPAWVE